MVVSLEVVGRKHCSSNIMYFCSIFVENMVLKNPPIIYTHSVVTETEICHSFLTLPFRVQNSNHLKGVQKITAGSCLTEQRKDNLFMLLWNRNG